MKSKVYKCKVYMILFIGLFGLSSLVAQDTTTTCNTKKTFVIRKNETNIPNQENKSSPASAVLIKKKIEPNLVISQIQLKSIVTAEQTPALIQMDIPAKMPTLAGGEFAMMDIRAYRENTDLKNCNFVSLQYSISEYGWAIKAIVFDTNDNALKNLVLNRLKKSKWNAAIDKAGKPMEYRMYKQVVLVKDRIYEEDYTND
jgi:hypothetical protein